VSYCSYVITRWIVTEFAFIEVRSINYIWHTVTVISHFLSVIPLFFLVPHSLHIFLAFLVFIYSSLSSFLDPPPIFLFCNILFSSLSTSHRWISCTFLTRVILIPSFLISFFFNSVFFYVYICLFLPEPFLLSPPPFLNSIWCPTRRITYELEPLYILFVSSNRFTIELHSISS
jgi:hypothetical protein